jgi:hypothetical protein
MISRTVEIVSAAAIAAALIGTVAVSRTVHTRPTATDARPTHDSTIGAVRGALTRPALNGYIACGTLSYSDCEKLETMLPM